MSFLYLLPSVHARDLTDLYLDALLIRDIYTRTIENSIAKNETIETWIMVHASASMSDWNGFQREWNVPLVDT